MYLAEHGRVLFGWLAAVGGSAATIAQDRIGGFTLSGIIAAATATAGAGLLIYDNARAKWRENRKKDLELEIERRRRTQELEMELKAKEQEAFSKADKEYRSSFKGQVAELKADQTQLIEQHKRDIQIREEYQAELVTALTQARENQDRFRQTNDEIVKQLKVLAAERDTLRQQAESANRHVAALESRVAELIATTATKTQAAAISAQVKEVGKQVRAGGSQDEIPIDHVQDPPP